MSYAYDLTRELPHPPERVWRALTDPVLLSRWFMRFDQDLASPPIGGRFTLTWTLAPDRDDTRLALHHAGWRGVRGFQTAQFLRMGWRTLVTNNLDGLGSTPGRRGSAWVLAAT